MIKDVIIDKTKGPGRAAVSQALVAIGKKIGAVLPALFAPDARTAERIIEFFSAQN